MKNSNLAIIIALFLILPITVLANEKAEEAKSNRIAIVVNDCLKIKNSLDIYVQDLKNEGYDPLLKEWSLIEQPRPEELKEYLKDLYNTPEGLQGAVFIGDLPVAHYEDEIRKSENILSYPTDHYYMDLENEWKDTDANCIFDYHANEIYGKRAIWVSRIKASGITRPGIQSWLEQLQNYISSKKDEVTLIKDEVTLIEHYFQKNHEFRTGIRLYDEKSWNYLADQFLQETREMESYGENLCLNKKADFFLGDLSKADFVTLLTSNRNELGLWQMHGGVDELIVNQKEAISSDELKWLDIKAAFLLLTCCLIGNYTEKDYLAGVLLFSEKSEVLALIAVTTTEKSWKRQYFAYPFQEGENIGNSYLIYLQTNDIWSKSESARVILGDGTLKRQRYIIGPEKMEGIQKPAVTKRLKRLITPTSIIPDINTLRFSFSRFQIFWDKYYSDYDVDLTYRLLKKQKDADPKLIYEGKGTMAIDPELNQDDIYYLEYVWNDPNSRSFTSKRSKVKALSPDRGIKYAMEKLDGQLVRYMGERRTEEEIEVTVEYIKAEQIRRVQILERLSDLDKAFFGNSLQSPTVALFVAIKRNDSLDLFSALLDYGFDPNLRCSKVFDRASPLILAIQKNRLNHAALLIERGVNLNLVDKFGKTALDYAKGKNYKDIEALLIQSNAKKEAQINAEYPRLDKIDFEKFKQYPMAGLFVVIRQNLPLDLFSALLDYGFDFNFQCPQFNDGASPLILAVQKDRPDIVSLLIAREANLDLKDDFGKTALDYAKEKNYKNIEVLLIQAGAKNKFIDKISINELIGLL